MECLSSNRNQPRDFFPIHDVFFKQVTKKNKKRTTTPFEVSMDIPN